MKHQEQDLLEVKHAFYWALFIVREMAGFISSMAMFYMPAVCRMLGFGCGGEQTKVMWSSILIGR